MSNFKITKTILENINEQNDRINECVDIVNGYTTDEETRVNQELQRQENELRREEQYNNNENRFTVINEQLEIMQNIKRNKTDLIKSNELDITSDTYKIKKNNLSEEVLAMLTPNANITIGGVVDNLSLVKEKYAINSIGVNQVDFLNTVNLINPNNITKGYFINGVTGNLQENANYNATDFIPVRQGDTLSQYLLWRTFFGFYDKDMNFIGNGGITELTDVFTVPNNAYFARFSTKDLSPTLIKSNTQITVKIPYEVQLSKDINLLKSIKDKSITKNLIDDEIAKISLGKNLFNKNTIEIDKYITTNGGISSATDWYLSDFIKVEGNKSINLSYGHNCNEYDENKNLIKTNSSLKTFTTMSNTRYIRFSCKNTYKLPSEFQVEYGNTETSYENYCYKINDNINGVPLIIGNSSSVNDYKGMDIISFGDSTVFQNKWQPKLMSYLQLGNHTNGGVSGSRISGNYQYHNAMWTDERLATLPNSEFNGLFFLLGGINDWAQNVPLGDITSKNTDEFYGALNVLIPKLIQKYPKAKIVLLSTTWCFMPDRAMFDDKIGLINNLGLMSVDYGQAILKIAKRYGLKSIDLSGLGWNNYNYTDYIPDRVHFNDLGGDLVAKEIVKGI